MSRWSINLRGVVIYRGWGGLVAVVVVPMVAWALGRLIGGPGSMAAALMLVLGAVGGFALAWWLNVTRAQTQLNEWRTTRMAQLNYLVQSGQFRLDNAQPPRSLAEAQQQANWLVEQESGHMAGRFRNHHHLYYVPAQWLAAGVVGISLLNLLVTIVRQAAG